MELRMSRKERDRLKVVAALAERRLRQRAAGRDDWKVLENGSSHA